MAVVKGLARGAVLLAAVFSASDLRGEVEIESIPEQPLFSFEYSIATDFSGLAWAGDDQFFAVSDKVRAIFLNMIDVERSTGKIRKISIDKPIPVITPLADFEGIAFVPRLQRVIVSAESGTGIFGLDLRNRTTTKVSVPRIFSNARNNKSLESLTYDSVVGDFWTANEEALKGDGALSGSGRGTTVRLQRFDSKFQAAGQYAYVTEGSGFRTKGGGTGLSELALLPNGDLLAMERVVGTFGLSVSIFKVELERASDISNIAALDGATFIPVSKKPLFSRATLAMNFEGMALGPELGGGWRSLILLSDSGGGTTHYLVPLRVRWTGN